MMKIKLKNQALINISLIATLCILSCDNKKEDKVNTTFEYGESWESGKRLFYSSCAQCHVPRHKDELFKRYLGKENDVPFSNKLLNLKAILVDSNHLGKNIQAEKFTEVQLKQLLEFVESPQRKRIIN